MNNSEDYKKIYEDLITRLTQKKSEQIFNVEKAFSVAEKQHAGQFRQTGEPYITHPLAVACILEKLDFDTDVISAALLHDVIEDTGYTVDQIEQNFNKQIAEIVDAVTAIAKSDYRYENDLIYDNSDFVKFSLEGKTFQKLLSMGKKNRFAFYIKFADRIHNLSTIESMAEYKKLEKVKETEKWILPICEILKTSYFYYQIKNECFLIQNEKKVAPYLADYHRICDTLQRHHAATKDQLTSFVSNFFAKRKLQETLYNIVITPRTPEQVFNTICNQLEIKSLNNVKPNHLLSVPLHDVYLLVKSTTPAAATGALFDLIEDSAFANYFSLIGYDVDEKFNMPYFVLEDINKNKYRIALLSYNDYITFLNGSTEGTQVNDLDDNAIIALDTSYISVKTPTNETVRIPQGSTLLDFAFKIHNDIGFSFKYGQINDSPNKIPQYAKLKEGDKVSIICETDPITKQNKYVAQIRWLAYVNTEYAKKALIRYFEKKYGESVDKK